jgi:transcriptional regulator with XRE-family HTH domain
MARPFNELRAKMSPESRARAEARTQTILAQMALQELRQSLHITQEQIAAVLNMNQAAVSKMESQDDMRVTTLFRFVAALGAKLKLIACFPEKEVIISQFDPRKR